MIAQRGSGGGRRLRVGLLCHSSCGGSTRVTVSLAHALAARDHAVHLFSLAPTILLGQVPDGLVVHHLRAPGGHEADRLYTGWASDDLDQLAERIAQVAETERLEILHFHYAVPFAEVALDVRRRLGAGAPRLIGTLHGTDVSVFGLDPAIGPGLADAIHELDAVTTVSASHAALATTTFDLRRRPEVIPNFIDLSRWRPGPDPRLPADRRPLRILHVSNFRPVKNPQAVARIFDQVRRHHDARLWFVGDGEEMPAVRATLDDAGRAGDVEYFGLRSDVERILPSSDLLLMTSHAESFCLTVLEAMACGVPVVAPMVGGIPEVVEHGRSGLLFAAGDDEGAVRAVGQLLSDRRRAVRMADEGRRRAQRFAADAVVPLYELLYRRVIERALQGAAPARTESTDHG